MGCCVGIKNQPQIFSNKDITVSIDENVKKMDDMNTENVKITDYPIEEIKKKNKQLKLEIAI